MVSTELETWALCQRLQLSNVNKSVHSIMPPYLNINKIYIDFAIIIATSIVITTIKREALARFLIWRFGKFSKDRQIKNLSIYINACVPMVLRIQIT